MHKLDVAYEELKIKLAKKIGVILREWGERAYLTYDKDSFFFPWGSFFLQHSHILTEDDVDLFLKDAYSIVSDNQFSRVHCPFCLFLRRGYYSGFSGRDDFCFTSIYQKSKHYAYRRRINKVEEGGRVNYYSGDGNLLNPVGWNPLLEERVSKLTIADFRAACAEVKRIGVVDKIAHPLILGNYVISHTGDVLYLEPDPPVISYTRTLVYSYRENIFHTKDLKRLKELAVLLSEFSLPDFIEEPCEEIEEEVEIFDEKELEEVEALCKLL